MKKLTLDEKKKMTLAELAKVEPNGDASEWLNAVLEEECKNDGSQEALELLADIRGISAK